MRFPLSSKSIGRYTQQLFLVPEFGKLVYFVIEFTPFVFVQFFVPVLLIQLHSLVQHQEIFIYHFGFGRLDILRCNTRQHRLPHLHIINTTLNTLSLRKMKLLIAQSCQSFILLLHHLNIVNLRLFFFFWGDEVGRSEIVVFVNF